MYTTGQINDVIEAISLKEMCDLHTAATMVANTNYLRITIQNI
jgi:hypothetical protein